MSLSRLGLSLGLGGGTSATSSGGGGGGAADYNISNQESSTADILARTGDSVGALVMNTTTADIYVYDGTDWVIFNHD